MYVFVRHACGSSGFWVFFDDNTLTRHQTVFGDSCLMPQTANPFPVRVHISALATYFDSQKGLRWSEAIYVAEWGTARVSGSVLRVDGGRWWCASRTARSYRCRHGTWPGNRRLRAAHAGRKLQKHQTVVVSLIRAGRVHSCFCLVLEKSLTV